MPPMISDSILLRMTFLPSSGTAFLVLADRLEHTAQGLRMSAQTIRQHSATRVQPTVMTQKS